jgi:hypothetical protein
LAGHILKGNLSHSFPFHFPPSPLSLLTNFIAPILAIVCAIALETLWHTLAPIRASEFRRLAHVPRLALSTILLVRTVAAVVVPVTKPHFLHAFLVVATELVWLTVPFGRTILKWIWAFDGAKVTKGNLKCYVVIHNSY